MPNNKINYITPEEYTTLLKHGLKYKGYVIGVGYAYITTAVIPPPTMNIVNPPKFVPHGMDHYQHLKVQCLDTSDEAIELSLKGNVKPNKNEDVEESGGKWDNYDAPMDKTRISPDYFGQGGDPSKKANRKELYMGGYMITQEGSGPSNRIDPFELKGDPSSSVNVGGYSPSNFMQAAIWLITKLGGTPETNRWFTDYGDTIIYNRHCFKGCCDYPTLGINKKDTIISLPITVTEEHYKKFLGW